MPMIAARRQRRARPWATGGVRPASRGGCGRGAERVRPRPGLRPVWSAFGGARGATRRSSRTDSARSISGRSSDRGARRGEARTRSAMCVTMAQESVSSASMPGAAYGDDVARDIPEKELSPAERVRRPRARRGPVRSRGDGHPGHAPVDAVMTYTWDARAAGVTCTSRGRPTSPSSPGTSLPGRTRPEGEGSLRSTEPGRPETPSWS